MSEMPRPDGGGFHQRRHARRSPRQRLGRRGPREELLGGDQDTGQEDDADYDVSLFEVRVPRVVRKRAVTRIESGVMSITDFFRGELIDIIEWTDDSRDTLSWRFPD